MEKYELEKLRDLSIEEVAQQLGMQVNVHHKALCPFHDDHHASLSFNTRKNTCRCFVCMEKSLGPIDLVMKQKHVDFLVACHWLADRFGIDIKGRKPAWVYSKNINSKSSGGTLQGAYLAGSSRIGTGCKSPGYVGNCSEGSCNYSDSCNASLKDAAVANASPKDAGQIRNPPSFDACRYLRFFEHPWLSDEARKFLFEERRLDERVVRWCRLSSWQDREGTHWLQIPYFDMQGNLIGMQNRNLDYHRSPTDFTDSTDSKDSQRKEGTGSSKKDGSGSSKEDGTGSSKEDGSEGEKGKREKPRFRFPYGAKCSIYNLPVVGRMKPGDELYITEGCSDCWAMLSAGHKAIAIPSATLLTPEDKVLLDDLSRRLSISWHMYPDRDAPGERLFLQLQELLPSLQHHQLPPGCKDFGEAYVKEVKGGE